jgi:hypothetical protein
MPMVDDAARVAARESLFGGMPGGGNGVPDGALWRTCEYCGGFAPLPPGVGVCDACGVGAAGLIWERPS